MSVNNMSFQDSAIILANIAEQATGVKTLAPTNSSEFVSVAQTALKTGYDPILNAISQVVGRTIFSVRPYTAKLRGMEFSEGQYGAITRKISFGDSAPEAAANYAWPVGYDAANHADNPTGDGESVDQWTIKKPDAVQTNFYGFDVWQDSVTLFREQIDVAFRSASELGAFFGGILENISGKHEQYTESFKRMTLANFIAGIIAENKAERIVHLLSEYNELTGQELTATTVYQPGNFKPFMQYVYSRVAEITSLFTERSQMFQTVLTGHNINRHTPYEDQRVYLYAPARYRAEMMAIADTYHDNYLRLADTETLNYWQSISTPDSINMTPAYTSPAGAVVTASAAVNQGGIFGVIADREAFGVAEIAPWQMATPLNAKGGYSNMFFHSKLRAFNDNTEKGVVLLLD